MVSVKLDEQGIVIEELERILKEHSVAAIYTTPHHQYPTTVTMTMSRRLQLLELSKKWGFTLLKMTMTMNSTMTAGLCHP